MTLYLRGSPALAPALTAVAASPTAIERNLLVLHSTTNAGGGINGVTHSSRRSGRGGEKKKPHVFDFLSLREPTVAPLDLELVKANQAARENAGTTAVAVDVGSIVTSSSTITLSALDDSTLLSDIDHSDLVNMDPASIAANAERILKEAHDRLEAERSEELAQKKKSKSKQVRYVIADSDPLIKACKRGEDDKVRELIALQDPEDLIEYVNSRDKNGSSPIMHTVWPGHLEALRILLENGANPNIQNNRQNTALHLACEREHHDLIVLLIQFGASISLLNVNQQTCYNTLSDSNARNKMENFTKRCWNDVRRGELGEQKYKLPKVERKQEWWTKEFYKRKGRYAIRKEVKEKLMRDGSTTDYASAANITASSSSPSDSLLRYSIHSPDRGQIVNENGVPDVGSHFYDFLGRSLGRRHQPRVEENGVSRKKRRRRKSREGTISQNASTSDLHTSSQFQSMQLDPTCSSDEDATLHDEGQHPHRQHLVSRRHSTGCVSTNNQFGTDDTMHLAEIIRNLSVHVDMTQDQKARIYQLAEGQIDGDNDQDKASEQTPPLPSLPITHSIPLHPIDQHTYVLSRLRTAAINGASSHHITGLDTQTSLPHAHIPDLVRPTKKLLKDLGVSWPVKKSRKMAKSSSSPILHRARHTSPSPPPPSKHHPATDAITLALDIEESRSIMKNPAYSNWVLRQLSVLKEYERECEEMKVENDLSDRTHNLAESLTHETALQYDQTAMKVSHDRELTGLIDQQLEVYLKRKYGEAEKRPTTDTSSAVTLSPSMPLLDDPLLSPHSSNTGKTKTPIHLTPIQHAQQQANSPSSPRLSSLAHSYLHDEKQSYLRELYAQISTVLTRIKKSSAILHVSQEMARKLRTLNPTMMDELTGRKKSSYINHRIPHLTGGIRTSAATQNYQLTSDEVEQKLEEQVRALITERKRVLESHRSNRLNVVEEEVTTKKEEEEEKVNENDVRAKSINIFSSSVSVPALGRTLAAPRSPSKQQSASTLTPSASEAVLNSTAIQRALIAQYSRLNEGVLRGGGGYERRPEDVVARVRLNTVSNKIKREPDVLEIHHSRPTTSHRIDSLESFARQVLEVPMESPPVSAVTALLLTRSPQQTTIDSSRSPITHADLNPVRRLSVRETLSRPGSSHGQAGLHNRATNGQTIKSAAVKSPVIAKKSMKASASVPVLPTSSVDGESNDTTAPLVAVKPLTTTVAPLFTIASHSSFNPITASSRPISMSHAIENDSSDTLVLLKNIRRSKQLQASQYKVQGRVSQEKMQMQKSNSTSSILAPIRGYETSPLDLSFTISRPSHHQQHNEEEKEQLQPIGTELREIVPSLTGMADGTAVQLDISFGYGVRDVGLRAGVEQSAEPEATIKEDEQKTSTSATSQKRLSQSRSFVNKEKAIKKRLSHPHPHTQSAKKLHDAEPRVRTLTDTSGMLHPILTDGNIFRVAIPTQDESAHLTPANQCVESSSTFAKYIRSNVHLTLGNAKVQ